jgi:hypothetical protein
VTDDERELLFVLSQQIKNLVAQKKIADGKDPMQGMSGAMINKIDHLIQKINRQTPE